MTAAAIADTILAALWRSSWQGAVAVVLVAGLCRLLATRLSADARCWLWRLVNVKLLLGLLVAGSIALPLLPAGKPSPPAPPPINARSSLGGGVPEPAGSGASREASGDEAPRAQHLSSTVAGTPRPSEGEGPGERAIAAWTLAAYLLGVAISLARLTAAGLRTGRLLRSAVPADDATAAEADHLARRLGLRRTPRIACSPSVASPLYAAGTVLLPEGAALPESDRRLVLTHELAHARRRDLLWECLGAAAQAVFFFHPLVVLARREERLARESAADALALRVTSAPAVDYGRLLVALSLAPRRRMPLVAAIGAAEGGSALERRVRALGAAGRPPLSGPRLAVVAGVISLAGVLAFVPWRLTRAEAPGDPPGKVSGAARPAAGQMPLPRGHGQISGILVDAHGRPIAGARVTLHLTIPPAGRRTAVKKAEVAGTTDASGGFVVDRLAPSIRYHLIFHPLPGQNGGLVYGPIVLNAGSSRRSIRVVVPDRLPVTGVVRDAKTGATLSGIRIRGEAGGGDSLPDFPAHAKVFAEGMTDDAGRYALRLPAGPATLRLWDTDLTKKKTIYPLTQLRRRWPVQVRPGTENRQDIPATVIPLSDLRKVRAMERARTATAHRTSRVGPGDAPGQWHPYTKPFPSTVTVRPGKT